MKQLRIYMAAALLLIGVGGAVLAAPGASADSPKSVVCSTLGGGNGCNGTPANSIDLKNVVAAVVNILSLTIGIVAVIVIMIAGLRMITASGDSSGIATARTSVIYALVGLVVAAMAQIIVRYVLRKV